MTRAPSRIKLARNRAPSASTKVRPWRSRRTRSGETWDVLQADSSSPIQGPSSLPSSLKVLVA